MWRWVRGSRTPWKLAQTASLAANKVLKEKEMNMNSPSGGGPFFRGFDMIVRISNSTKVSKVSGILF